MGPSGGMNIDPRVEVLSGIVPVGAESLTSRLDRSHVVIRTSHAHGALALATANLLARLVPSVEIECTDDSFVTIPVFGAGTIAELGRRTVVAARLRPPAPSAQSFIIGVGIGDSGADLYVSASCWSLLLSSQPHLPLLGRGPAVAAASGLAAAEVVRRLVPELPGPRLREQIFAWNLLDYQCTVAETEPPVGEVDIVCFGAGSVGSSLIYSLLLSEGHGRAVVVDPDKLTPRNRIRYPLWLHEPALPKVDWLEGAARGTGLSLTGIRRTAATFIADHRDPILLAVAAVDSVAARRDVADALALQTLNAGVSAAQFHVSRHGFNDGFACVYCGYVDAGDALDQAGVYSEMTGLEMARVKLLISGELLSDQDVRTLIANGVLQPAERCEFEGSRLQDVVRQRLYASVEARMATGSVPIAAPYVSALAGAILGAEAQKASLAGFWLDRRVDVDCSGWPTGLQSRPAQDRTGRCLCRDPLRTEAFRRIWLPHPGEPSQAERT